MNIEMHAFEEMPEELRVMLQVAEDLMKEPELLSNAIESYQCALALAEEVCSEHVVLAVLLEFGEALVLTGRNRHNQLIVLSSRKITVARLAREIWQRAECLTEKVYGLSALAVPALARLMSAYKTLGDSLNLERAESNYRSASHENGQKSRGKFIAAYTLDR